MISFECQLKLHLRKNSSKIHIGVVGNPTINSY